MDLDGLIAELEKATEPSRELDARIASALEITWSSDEDGNFGGYGLLPRRCHYTRSLDAALSLVGDKWTDIDISICSVAFLIANPPPKCSVLLATGDLNSPRTKQVEGRHDSAAMATVITALKARRALSSPPTAQAS